MSEPAHDPIIVPQRRDGELSRSRVKIIGLTGGAGSGKSEVAAVLKSLGLPVIHADKVGHELLEKDPAVIAAIREVFGTEVFRDGKVDRTVLRARVFGDVTDRNALNAIVHPRMAIAIEEQCRTFVSQGHDRIIIDGALLCENGQKDSFLDALIVVHSDRETRIGRLILARDLTRREAEQIVDAQTDPRYKLDFADWVIENTGTLKELRAAARRIGEEIMRYGG